jgi:hypothetical protein
MVAEPVPRGRSLTCSTKKRVAPFFYSAGRATVFVASQRLLSLSRCSVRKVVSVGSDEPPIIVRPRKLDAHRERIAQMLAKFDGNVVKVHRALADAELQQPLSCRHDGTSGIAGTFQQVILPAESGKCSISDARTPLAISHSCFLN